MYRGTTQRGVASITENQIKKHITQMSKNEKDLLNSALSNINTENITYSFHVLKKLNTKFAHHIIRELLVEANIDNVIEVNFNKYHEYVRDVRVLLRDNKKHNVEMLDYNTGKKAVEEANLCVVYSLTTHRIVTVYWNKANDNHKTVNWYRYNQHINMIKYKNLMMGGFNE